jgi:uncharacterized protein
VKLVDGEALPPPMADAPSEKKKPDLVFAIVIGFFIGSIAGALRFLPAMLRRGGAALVAGGLGWILLSAGLGALVAAIIALLFSGAGGGRFGSGRGGWGYFPGGSGGGGWSGGGGGGWGGGGGSFGGGGASGGW